MTCDTVAPVRRIGVMGAGAAAGEPGATSATAPPAGPGLGADGAGAGAAGVLENNPIRMPVSLAPGHSREPAVQITTLPAHGGDAGAAVQLGGQGVEARADLRARGPEHHRLPEVDRR